MLRQADYEQPKAVGQVVLSILDDLRYTLVNVANALRDRETKFDQKPPDLVGLCRPGLDKTLARTVYAQEGLLAGRLRGNSRHLGARGGFENAFRISYIVQA